jgi:hypothetical protein
MLVHQKGNNKPHLAKGGVCQACYAHPIFMGISVACLVAVCQEGVVPMIFPTITDRDEWNYLDTLTEFARVGYPHSADQDYYARVLRYKYPQCHA